MRPKDIPLMGPFKNVSQDNPEYTLNWYGETVSNDIYTLKPTPGSEVSWEPSGYAGGGRAAISVNGRFFIIRGFYLLEDVAGTTTLRGTLETKSGAISLVSNGFQLLVVDTVRGYVLTLDGNAFNLLGPDIPDSGGHTQSQFLGGAGQAVFCGGRAVVIRDPSSADFPSRWQVSGNYEFLDWNDTAFEAMESSATPITGFASNGNKLYIFSSTNFEIWENQGLAIQPFVQVQSGDKVGCSAPGSIVVFQRYVYWLGESEGKGMFYRHAVGGIPDPINDFSMARNLAAITDKSDALAYAYESLGHFFYCVLFTSGQLSYAYDISTSLWAERSWRLPDTGEKIPVPFAALALHLGEFYGVSYRDGIVHRQSDQLFSNGGNPIVRTRITSPYPNEASDLSYYSDLELFCETGNTPVGNSPPQAMMKYTGDRGKTWSSEIWRQIGGTGSYAGRVQWTGLGCDYTRCFSITIVSDQYLSLRMLRVNLE